MGASLAHITRMMTHCCIPLIMIIPTITFMRRCGICGVAMCRRHADRSVEERARARWRCARVCGRGAVHPWLAFAAIQATLGHPSPSGGTQSRQATATVFRFPKGDWVVLLAALAVGGFGVYQVYKAFAPKLHRHVNEREVTDEAGGWLIVVSRIGIAARGVVFMAIALLLFHAAREHDPRESRRHRRRARMKSRG